MSLKEDQFKSKTEERLKNQVEKYLENKLGAPIKVEVEWDTFGDIASNDLLLTKGVYTSVFEKNISSLSSNDLAKNAITKQVKSIKIRNVDSEDESLMGYKLENDSLVYIASQSKHKFTSSNKMLRELEAVL